MTNEEVTRLKALIKNWAQNCKCLDTLIVPSYNKAYHIAQSGYYEVCSACKELRKEA
jgi:hypothetical protein